MASCSRATLIFEPDHELQMSPQFLDDRLDGRAAGGSRNRGPHNIDLPCVLRAAKKSLGLIMIFPFSVTTGSGFFSACRHV